MAVTITATNPTELREEAERLLRAGLPLAGAPLLAITGVEPDFEYAQSCDMPGCAANITGRACQPALNAGTRAATAAVEGLSARWVRHGATGVLAREWDADNPMSAKPLSAWEYACASHAAQTIGFDLTKGGHSSVRQQAFWISGDLLVVVTSSDVHGEVLHTIEPLFPRQRQARCKQQGKQQRKRQRKQQRSSRKGRR